jgi:hypothetical protein
MRWTIESSEGVQMGTYGGDTMEQAYQAMLEDAGSVDQQVEALRDEAGEAGDIAQVAICQRALGRLDDGRDYGEGEVEQAQTVAAAMTVDEARAECIRAILDAQIQAGLTIRRELAQ